MKLQQIQYVIEINRANSISKAAKNLFTSQSHISNELKALEEELGFIIFERTSFGVRPTEQGKSLLELATSIYELTDKMHAIKKEKVKHEKVSIATENMSFCLEAFSTLCRKHESSDLNLICGKPQDVCSMVAQSKCELGILTANTAFSEAFVQNLKSNGLHATKLATLGLYLRLSKDNPIYRHFQQTGNIDYSELSKYPYVNTADSDNSLRYVLNDIFGWLITDSTNKVSISDREYKKRIVATTNAWSIGVSYSAKDEEAFEGVRILIPGVSTELYYITAKNKNLTPLAKEFMMLLNDELKEVVRLTDSDMENNNFLKPATEI